MSKTLIIENPQGQRLAQRLTGAVLTTIAWLVLLYILIPCAAFVLGLHQFAHVHTWVNLTSYDTWAGLAPLIPRWALAAVVLISALYLWATIQFLRFRNSRRRSSPPLVTTAELAKHCGFSEDIVKGWATASRLVADYDETTNKMASVSTQENAPFRRDPKEGERPAPSKKPAKPVSAAEGTARRQAMLEKEIEEYRQKTLACYVRIDATEVLLADIISNKDRYTPDRDIALYRDLNSEKQKLREEIADLQMKAAQCRLLIESLKSLKAPMAMAA